MESLVNQSPLLSVWLFRSLMRRLCCRLRRPECAVSWTAWRTGTKVILVDDGSADGSNSVIRDMLLQWPQLRLLELQRNSGHQAALAAGLAVPGGGDYVVSIDADLQDSLKRSRGAQPGPGRRILRRLRRGHDRTTVRHMRHNHRQPETGSRRVDLPSRSDSADFRRERLLQVLILAALAVLAISVRAVGFDKMNGDMALLIDWYNQLANAGGVAGLANEVGNYNAPFLYLLLVATWIPGPPIFAIKLVFVVFDVVSASTSTGSSGCAMPTGRCRRSPPQSLYCFPPSFPTPPGSDRPMWCTRASHWCHLPSPPSQAMAGMRVRRHLSGDQAARDLYHPRLRAGRRVGSAPLAAPIASSRCLSVARHPRAPCWPRSGSSF